ncbi:hypothetical protein [Tahibacter amnicola]|uniref:Membrane protein DUF2207 n=1 Tax=Tahibacter amnicola TaxID=2976241 RepID=A0ABY6BFP0_9GAMM|nr:hypothetical protein [Tahibacter amnicola]UXI68841.1 hypothetical protein N4264_04070 [Tahibacter amnicola]
MRTIVSALTLLVLVGMLLWQLRIMGNLGRRQQALLDELATALRGKAFFRVHLARRDMFVRRMKMQPSEARGLLIPEDDAVRLVAIWPDGSRFDQRIGRDALNLAWIGQPGLNAGNLHWLSVGEPPLYISADTGMNAVSSLRQTADLYRSLMRPGDLEPPARDFALEKNPASLTAVVLVLALVAYTVLDGIGNPYTLLNTSGASRFLPVFGVLALPLAYPVLVRWKVPARESLVTCLLMSLTLAFAVIPLGKRIDGLLASESFRDHEYRLTATRELEPVDPASPLLRLRPHKEYWAQFPVGSVHRMPLRKGGLGLWQADTRDFSEKVRRWYEAHPSARQK